MNSVTELMSLALQALAPRALVFLSLAMAFGLFAWAMYLGQWIPLAVAVAFAVLVFLPVHFKGSRRHESQQTLE